MTRDTWILHVDLDAFFASVEQRDKPSLRGKPVVVGGVGQRGVVATASYEARAFGVRSAMSTREAKRLCGHAAYLNGRFHAYAKDSQLVMNLLRELSTDVEPLSLDEAYVDLGVLTFDMQAFTAMARELREAITDATGGLTASVGIARSKLLAKLASEINKPNGQFIVAPGTETALLGPMSVRALPGIGPATEERLLHVGVKTVDHARSFARSELVSLLGEAAGSSLYDMVRAVDHRKVESNRPRKSVSIEDTFEQDIFALDSVLQRLDELVAQLVTRMAHGGYSGRTIGLKVRDSTFATSTRNLTLSTSTRSHGEIMRALTQLIHGVDLSQGVRLLGVSVSNLSPWVQDALFEDDADLENEQVASPTDAISLGEPDSAKATVHSTVEASTWRTGMDIHHETHGDGWVWGSGLGLVTVRFETRFTAPGRVLTLPADDPALSEGHWDTF